jgi:REP element-mobilizing transposase RayT
VTPPTPVDPTGCYHVGTRGNYGQPLFRSPAEHELFLRLYNRAASKYGWITLTWALVFNHHHFIIQLTQGGLSDGMQQLHCGYSRRIHQIDGHTGQGHLIRHRFFRSALETDAAVLVACRYVDLNIPRATGCRPKRRSGRGTEPWSASSIRARSIGRASSWPSSRARRPSPVEHGRPSSKRDSPKTASTLRQTTGSSRG